MKDELQEQSKYSVTSSDNCNEEAITKIRQIASDKGCYLYTALRDDLSTQILLLF